jgi:NADPH:quinone reductase-like Zn-dependent oxidoreductase
MDEALQLVDSKTCKSDSMAVLKEFLEAGKITPVIDRTYPLSEVPDAIRYLEEGYAQGKIIITVRSNPDGR